MSFRVGLIAALLAGCYSPSFDTCSLACASGDVCPSGFSCSNGRCAREGTSCVTSDGDIDDGAIDVADSMPIDDMPATCGDGTSMEGEICFTTLPQINLMVSGIYDGQIADINGMGGRDIVFLDNSGFQARLNVQGGFPGPTAAGPVVSGKRMLAVSLDGNSLAELVVNNASMNRLEIYQFGGTTYSVVANAGTQSGEARGLAIGKLASASAPPAIAVVFDDKLRAYQLPSAPTSLMPLGGQQTVTNGRDVAIGDFDNDSVGEIAVADMAGVEVFRGLNNNPSKISGPSIGAAVDSIAACNIDGSPGSEIVYSIAPAVGASTIGVARWIESSGGFELTSPQMVSNAFFPIECADLDKDGKADVIATAGDGNGNIDLVVLRGKSDGSLETPKRFRIPSAALYIHATKAAEDLNGDMVPDIVLTSREAGLITVLVSNP